MELYISKLIIRALENYNNKEINEIFNDNCDNDEIPLLPKNFVEMLDTRIRDLLRAD